MLGGAVVVQGVRAFRLREALGFTLVALTDGFLVLAVRDVGGPVWSLFVTGALVAVAGDLPLVPAPLSRARTAPR